MFNLLIKQQETPKIIINNPNMNFTIIFKTINNNKLNASVKEHLFKPTHNILPTGERLKRCKYKQSDNCQICLLKDTMEHTFGCAASAPAIRWILEN